VAAAKTLFRRRVGARVAEVVMYFLDARNIFCGDDRCLPGSIILDDAAQAHDTVTHDDVEPAGSPGTLLDGCYDRAANMVVICRRARSAAGKVGDSQKKIRPGDNSGKSVPAYNRKVFDVIGLHDLHDLLQRRILCYSQRIGRHDLADLAAVLMREV